MVKLVRITVSAVVNLIFVNFLAKEFIIGLERVNIEPNTLCKVLIFRDKFVAESIIELRDFSQNFVVCGEDVVGVSDHFRKVVSGYTIGELWRLLTIIMED